MNDLDRPLRASKKMRELGFFLDPNRMSNQDLVDECIALGAGILIEEIPVHPAEFHILAGDIIDCIEMSLCDRHTIEMLMEQTSRMGTEEFVWA